MRTCGDFLGEFRAPSALWNVKIPSKVVFFVWTACRDWLPMVDYILKRGMIIPNVCALCLQDGESVNPILIHCLFA